ncbi:hypothetical protein PZA11_005662 [Diplocarpon coronariae]
MAHLIHCIHAPQYACALCTLRMYVLGIHLHLRCVFISAPHPLSSSMIPTLGYLTDYTSPGREMRKKTKGKTDQASDNSQRIKDSPGIRNRFAKPPE